MSVEIYHGDCKDLLQFARDAKLIYCDPPYSEYVHANAVSAGMLEHGIGPHKRDFGFDSLTPELRATIVEFVMNCQGWSILHSDFETAHEWLAALPQHYIRTIPWVRWSQPQKSGDRPPQGWEPVLLFHPSGRKMWNGPGSLIDFEHEVVALDHKSLRGSEKHPTEKPLDQALDLVSWLSQPGDLVIDCTCGRGTVALACKLLDREFLGADTIWAPRAIERVSAPLDERDTERARRYCSALIPAGKDPTKQSEMRTWERAKRRESDVERVRSKIAI